MKTVAEGEGNTVSEVLMREIGGSKYSPTLCKETTTLYPNQRIYAGELGNPAIPTLLRILGSLVLYGNLRRTELHRRLRISYTKFIQYIEWLKWKNLVVEHDSYIAINEKGRMLHDLLV